MSIKGRRTERYAIDEQVTRRQDELSDNYDQEIVKMTNRNTAPTEFLRRILNGKSKLPVSPVKMLLARESNYSGKGRFSASENCHVSSRYVPVHGPKVIDTLISCAYISQFSMDGSLLVAGFQGGDMRIYNFDGGWRIRNEIEPKNFLWTFTDASLSPDNRFLAYSSMLPVLNLVDVTSASTESDANVTVYHEGLDISREANHFEVFSVRFSTDGRELVAGCSDNSIYIYDLQGDKLCFRIHAHMRDVNTVCFADESGQLIYSGSDDGLCKVWDRRCLENHGRAVGVLTGHSEGITFIDSRRDGRYFISNGKDQSIKLWDIRKMSTNATSLSRRRMYTWDYRYGDYPSYARGLNHTDDRSLATYKGHSIKQTLIRCYFSPAYSTGQKYIYTGSGDNSVYIYDMVSGNEVAKMEYHVDVVRDCSWHPNLPMIVSSSWDGTIARWEFPGGEGRDPTPIPPPEEDYFSDY